MLPWSVKIHWLFMWSVYNGETKKNSRSIEHQQESIKGNWSSSGAIEHTKECHGHFDWLCPKTLLIKFRCYDRKVRELLEIDMAVARHWQDKVLNRETMGTLLRQMCVNLCSKKWKYSIEIWHHFVLKDGFALYSDQIENGFNRRVWNISLWII